jgi:hypothetical protein
MFPLKIRKIGGFTFGQIYPKSFGSLAGHKHLGVDYHATTGTPLYAPFDGKIVSTLVGKEGGKTIWFKPEKDNVIMRFMHLSNIGCMKGDLVFEGKVIGLTGNTGSATNAPHLHLDISKDHVNIYDFSNFINPEKYKWEIPKTPEPPVIPEYVDVSSEPKNLVEVPNIASSDVTQPDKETLIAQSNKEMWQDAVNEIVALFKRLINLFK